MMSTTREDLHSRGETVQTVYAHFERSEALGNSEALVQLIKLYNLKKLVKLDRPKSFELYQRAEVLENPDGANEVTFFLSKGVVVERDNANVIFRHE